jgi:hypothetical protein
MTPYSACHPTQASQKRAPSASVSLTRHSSIVSQRIRAVPQIVNDEAYRFYFAAADGNECAAQVLTDLQLRRIFSPIQLGTWPTADSYRTALTVAGGGDLTPLIHLINARLQERKALLPAGRIIQSPFDVLSRNWTSLDRNLPNSELLSLHRS